MAESGRSPQQQILQNPDKKIGNYFLGKTIGEGTFGKVKLATHSLTGQRVAIKILEKQRIVDVADVERVSREIHILKLIRHPNIIQLYEIIETTKHLFLVMEYVEKGELFNYIVEKNRQDFRSLGLQILQTDHQRGGLSAPAQHRPPGPQT